MMDAMALQRKTFEDAFTAMRNMRDQIEQMTRAVMAQGNSQPESIRNALSEWRYLVEVESDQFKEKMATARHHAESFLSACGVEKKQRDHYVN